MGIVRRNAVGQSGHPARKKVASEHGVGRRHEGRVVILNDGVNGSAAVGIESKGVRIHLPLGGECHVGCWHAVGQCGLPT